MSPLLSLPLAMVALITPSRLLAPQLRGGNNINTIGGIKLLNEMLRLGVDQKSMRAPVEYGQGLDR
jgi:hypothetical protein